MVQDTNENKKYKKKIKVIEDYGIDYNTLEILENESEEINKRK